MKQERRKRNGKSALVLLLALVLALPAIIPVSSYASGNFPDTTGHWAEKFISRAYNLDIVDGYSSGKFLPDKAVTRAEFISMVNKAIELDTSATSNFSDVSPGQWYYDDISEAVASSYASGYSDNTFRPNVPLTRQEAAVMLSKILPNYKEKGSVKNFRDSRLIAAWAVAPIEKLVGQSYMGAYSDGRFYPDAPITRAQMAKILCDILDNETIVTDDTIVDVNNTTLTGKIYVGDVTISEDLGEGNATIDNCVLLGTLYVEGGGSKSVTINNSRVSNMVVRKSDSPVRVVTKGTTVIPKVTASKSSILQTSGKGDTGMLEVTINKTADVTLKGTFPIVNIEGTSSLLTLESGKITTLTVAKAGRYSDITLTGKAEVTEATVNAESYFHGTGTIVHMSVNADGITYETKPKKMSVGVDVDRALGEADTNSDLEVEFDPGNKDDNVDLDAKIALTFNTSVKLATDVLITSSNIKNFVTLHTASKGGITVECAGTINAAKKIVTLTPKNELSPDTRYYVVLADETVMNANGSKNNDDYIYFTTGTESSNSMASYDPDDGEKGIAASGASITVRFDDDVVMYSSGAEVTDAYLQQCITFRSGNAISGSAVTFTATISSRDKITIKPSGGLTPGQTYTVAVVANKLKTKTGGKAITGSSATWTVAPAVSAVTYANLSTLTLAPAGGSNVLTGFGASTNNYSVTVPFGTNGVDVAATAASGTSIQINGTITPPALNIPVTGSAITPITVVAAASGMTSTTYTVNVTVAGNTSVASIEIDGIFLKPVSAPYATNVPAAAATTTIIIVAADPNATVKVGNNSGTHACGATINLGPENQDIPFEITSNMTTKTYTIHISRQEY
jgi:hypothetical protein